MFSLSVLTKTANYSKCDGFSSILDLKVMGAFIICEWFMRMWGVLGGSGDAFCASQRKVKVKRKSRKTTTERERNTLP